MPLLGRPFDAGGSRFTFASPANAEKNRAAGGEAPAERGTRASRMKGGDDCSGRPEQLGRGGRLVFGGAAADYRDHAGGVLDGEDRLSEPEDDHPGGGDPLVLWGKARPPRPFPVYPVSEGDTMAKYRKEMMELVRGVPEAAYELSLRDLVEVPRMAAAQEEEESSHKGRGATAEAASVRGRRKRGKKAKKQIPGGATVDSGVFMLKMFFPSSLLGRTKRGVAGGAGSKVSPKPVEADPEKGRRDKKVDAEWSEDDLQASSHRRKSMGCYPFSFSRGTIR